MSRGTFWLVEKAVFWLPDLLIISGERQGNQPWDWKHKFHFLPIFFPPSLLLALWHPTERQLAQTTSLPHGDEEVEEEMGEWCKRSMIRGVYEIFFQPFYNLIFITSCGKNKGNGETKKGRQRQRKLHHLYGAKCYKKRLTQSCLGTDSLSLSVSPLPYFSFGLSPTHTAIYSNICMVHGAGIWTMYILTSAHTYFKHTV